jgi:hypothetical protein
MINFSEVITGLALHCVYILSIHEHLLCFGSQFIQMLDLAFHNFGWWTRWLSSLYWCVYDYFRNRLSCPSNRPLQRYTAVNSKRSYRLWMCSFKLARFKPLPSCYILRLLRIGHILGLSLNPFFYLSFYDIFECVAFKSLWWPILVCKHLK